MRRGDHRRAHSDARTFREGRAIETARATRSGRLSRLLPAAGAAAAAIALGKIALDQAQLGPVAGHMAVHILLMNAVTPLLALAALRLSPRLARRFSSGPVLAAAALAQVIALWGWHAPPVLGLSMESPLVHFAAQASLTLAAGLFWLAVLADRSPARWRALLALLLTGKLFCLLGVLLVFAPRLLYPGIAEAHGHELLAAVGAATGRLSDQQLADQQLAGLLMVVACPLSYLVAGVAIAARWLAALADGGRAEGGLAGPA